MARKDILEKAFRYTLHQEVKDAGVYPYFKPLVGSEGGRALIDGRPRIMLGSNNYLGLTHHPEVMDAARRAIDAFGTGCTGSRMLNGTLELHEALEAELADWLGVEAVLLWSTGFMSNSGSVGALCTRKDIIFADREDHASLLDGFLLSGARLVRFRHNDMDHLRARLEQHADHPGGRLIAVDGVYSMTGELAPVDQLADLAAEFGCRLLVDEAHALGVVGPGGRGTCAHFDRVNRVDLITGTFSKTFAAMGGFIGCQRPVVEYLKHHARQIMYTASFTPATAATVLASLRILRREPALVDQVRANADWMRGQLQALGFDCLESATAVVPIVIGEMEKVLWFNRRIYEEGVFANPVFYPAVPRDQGLIRTSYMATHRREDLEEALAVFEKVGREMNLIVEGAAAK